MTRAPIRAGLDRRLHAFILFSFDRGGYRRAVAPWIALAPLVSPPRREASPR